MINAQSWITEAEAQLKAAGISSARLDAELLLADLLQKPRTWLLAYNHETILSPSHLHELSKQLKRRLKREPLAYIRGFQEFYGRNFIVNQHTLIPRPETETIIEIVANLPIRRHDTLVDVGTGSGCIAISAKLEQPLLSVYGVDSSKEALSVARQNASSLGAEITLLTSDLLHAPTLPQNISIITANLPYVARDWQTSVETTFEPKRALYANKDGLELIFKLLMQAPAMLQAQGQLILEADTRQHASITQKALSTGFHLVLAKGFVLHFQQD